MTLEPRKLMVWGYLPHTAVLTMFAWNMSIPNSSMMACVTAAAAAVKPVVYSTPVSTLRVGTWTTSLFPPRMGCTSVSSSLSTLRMSLTLLAILSALATTSTSISLPLMYPPATRPVLRPFSIPARSTAMVLLARDTILWIAGLYRGLIASRGTSFSMSLPLSSYKSILSLYFAKFLPPFSSSFNRPEFPPRD